MKCGDLSCLYQLGVGMNWGFGAILIFSQPAKRLFEQSISSVEARLVELNASREGNETTDKEVNELFDLNRSYLKIAADAGYLSFETYIWQSMASRLVFLASGLGCFAGLIVAASYAESPASLPNLWAAIVFNLVPMLAAVTLFAGWCWFEYKILPRVENMEERLTRGHSALVSQLRASLLREQAG
jgi:hypothetical protein